MQQYHEATLMECEISPKHLLQKEASVPQEFVKAEDTHGSIDEAGMVPDHKLDTQYEALIISTDAATNQEHLNAFLSSLLKSMNNHVDVGVFKEPVDIINDAIDMKTITERVESGKHYLTVEMFVADVKRMAVNVCILHGPNSMRRRCADRFQKYFDIKLNCEYIMWAP